MHNKIPYRTYTVKELESFGMVLNTIMKEDCILLSWVCTKNLADMLYLLNLWGFKYFNILLVWAKLTRNETPHMGLGYWSRNCVEFLLMSKRGQVAKLKTP